MGFSKIRKKAQQRLMEIAMSERAMKLLADPRVQKAMIAAFEAQGKLKKGWREGTAATARRFNLATRQDVKSLQRKVRELEGRLEKRATK